MTRLSTTPITDHDYNRASADHERSNWHHAIVLRDGQLDVDTHYGNGTTMDVWQGRALELCRVPDGTADAGDLAADIEQAADTIAAILAGLSVEWDGSNYVGHLTDAAAELLEQLSNELQQAAYDLPCYWWAAEWMDEADEDEVLAIALEGDRKQAIADVLHDALHSDVYLDPDDLDAYLTAVAAERGQQ